MPKLTVSWERACLGWGMFDAIYIIRYALFCLFAGKTPYVDDFTRGIELLADHGAYAKVLAIMTWGFEISVIVSCVLFLARWRAARWLAWIQIPFRLVFFLPSVSILFMGSDIAQRYGIGWMLLLVLLSEYLKGWTLWATRQHSL